MAFVNESSEALSGYVTRLWSAAGAVIIAKQNTYQAPADLLVRKQVTFQANGAATILKDAETLARGTANAGRIEAHAGEASLTIPKVRIDPATEGADITGILIRPSRASEVLGLDASDLAPASFGVGPAELDTANAALEAGRVKDDPALQSYDTSGKLTRNAIGTFDANKDAETESRLALDAADGEAVDFMVDIQDSILASGHGDC